MKLLDLFCGTKSVSRSFEKLGYDIVTLDNDPQFNADITMDILEVTIQELRSWGPFDVIWASPPCQKYSVCTISRNWNKIYGTKYYVPTSDDARLSNQVVKHTLALIKGMRPTWWFIENPRGMLRKQRFMVGLPRSTVTYCQYGDTKQKPTDIWGMFPPGFPLKKCKAGDPCHDSCPRTSHSGGVQGQPDSIKRAMIPEEFTRTLANMILLDHVRGD